MTTPIPPFAPPPPAWPTEAAKPDELAGPRSQVAVYLVCCGAMAIAAGAAGELGWGVAGMLALAGGVAIGIVADLGRRFESAPGAAVSLLVMAVLTVGLAFIGGSVLAFACVPLLGAVILGLDWRLVRRLRPLPFASGFAVVIGVAGGASWTYAAGLAWLVLALGALASLEADRRTGQHQVVAVTGGPPGDALRSGDLATTVLVAVAVALVAALVLSTPSCQRSTGERARMPGDLGQGAGEPGGGEPGSGSGRYVPDPDGQFLVPDGTGASGVDGSGIPSPTLLPQQGEAPRELRYDDGTAITAERLEDGSGRVVVRDPDGTTRTYTYRDRADGTIEIQERDQGGNVTRTFRYDPNGRIATNEGGGTSGSSGDPGSSGSPGNAGTTPSGEPHSAPTDQEDPRDRSPDVDGRVIAGIVLALAALGGLTWWLTRRTPPPPPPDAPPWAIRLAREIDREGAARGPARRRSQSLSSYAGALNAGPIPDSRVPDVADAVSTALFGRRDPGPDAQHWAESTWAQIVAAHPVPSRSDRRRAKAGASSG